MRRYLFSACPPTLHSITSSISRPTERPALKYIRRLSIPVDKFLAEGTFQNPKTKLASALLGRAGQTAQLNNLGCKSCPFQNLSYLSYFLNRDVTCAAIT